MSTEWPQRDISKNWSMCTWPRLTSSAKKRNRPRTTWNFLGHLSGQSSQILLQLIQKMIRWTNHGKVWGKVFDVRNDFSKMTAQPDIVENLQSEESIREVSHGAGDIEAIHQGNWKCASCSWLWTFLCGWIAVALYSAQIVERKCKVNQSFRGIYSFTQK